MTDIYRFRTIQQVLNEYHELNRQTVYFAPQRELNDPLEGIRDVFWAGDEVTWPNLFDHYMFCLNQFYLAYKNLPNDLQLNAQHIPVYMHKGHIAAQKQLDIISEIERRVRHQTILFDMIPSAFNYKRRVRRGELWIYLRSLHEIALKTIDDVYIDFQLVPEIERKNYETEDSIQKIKDLGFFDLLNRTKDHKVPEEVFTVLRNLFQKSSLEYVLHTDEHDESLRFMLFDFPASYIEKIEEMSQFAWYVTCFSKEYKNSAMWGHYAGNHTGVCLVFQTEINDDQEGLTFSHNPSDESIGDHERSIFIKLNDVNYRNQPGPCDFFRCVLGTIDPDIWRWWLMDEDGSESDVFDGLDFNDDAKLLAQYRLDQMFADVLFKTTDWSYEKEKRLILYQSNLDLTDKSRRVLKYYFNSLKGIIFGMKTNENDRLRIMEIIDKKCREAVRDDFEYYQAYYSPITGEIEKVRIHSG